MKPNHALRYTRAVIAERELCKIRDYLSRRDAPPCPRLLAKVRSAIRSAQGAIRNAHRFAAKQKREHEIPTQPIHTHPV